MSWDCYFMGVALLSKERSKDPDTQVGACLVNDENKIVGVGYNGMPIGISDDIFPWGKDESDTLNDKRSYVCHAELNAVLNSFGERTCKKIYVTRFPCNECAKVIIQSRISRVIYYEDPEPKSEQSKISREASKRMLSATGVRCEKYSPIGKQLVLEL